MILFRRAGCLSSSSTDFFLEAVMADMISEIWSVNKDQYSCSRFLQLQRRYKEIRNVAAVKTLFGCQLKVNCVLKTRLFFYKHLVCSPVRWHDTPIFRFSCNFHPASIYVWDLHGLKVACKVDLCSGPWWLHLCLSILPL